MLEQFVQLGIGGVAIVIVFLVVKMFLEHLKAEREDRTKVLAVLSENIVGLSSNIAANSKLTAGVGETMQEVKKSLEDHNDFVKNYVRQGGGGKDEDHELPITWP